MDSPEPIKRIKRSLRELSERAYAEVLSRELAKLQESFQSWRAGELSPFDLGEEIHRFHQGPNRKLYIYYTSSSHHESDVAEAIIEGLIPESAVPEEVRRYLAPWIERLQKKP
ncbi:MAG: hypothetical protein ACHQPI_11070 [Thermoanaerobaculia bacterium]